MNTSKQPKKAINARPQRMPKHLDAAAIMSREESAQQTAVLSQRITRYSRQPQRVLPPRKRHSQLAPSGALRQKLPTKSPAPGPGTRRQVDAHTQHGMAGLGPDLGPHKPPFVNNGKFSPVYKGKIVDQLVYASNLDSFPANTDALSVSITAGAPSFRIESFSVYDLVLERVDPGELPPGSPPILYWDEILVATWDGSTPLPVEHGQRIELRITLSVTSADVKPGDLDGVVSIQGTTYFQTIELQSQYLAVDPNTPIGRRWTDLGGEAFLWPPLENEHSDPTGPGERQMFENGVLYQISGHGVTYFSWNCFAKWADGTQLGDDVRDAVGLPTGDTFVRPDAVELQLFEFGAIVVRENGMWCMMGAIYADYISVSSELFVPGSDPQIGLPLSDEQSIPGGRYQPYDFADYYWTPATGAHLIYGDIRNRWFRLGFLGLPVTDPYGGNAGGVIQRFQQGMIFWSPATGAQEVHGAILGRYARLGYENSHFGYPISDEQPWVNPANNVSGRISFFQNGQIAWTPSDGVLELPPQTITLQQEIETPSGTALGGFAGLTIRSDGTYSFFTHIHDSGFDSYSFQIRVVLQTISGVQFMAQHSGSVGGTAGGGSRDDDYSESGFSSWIRDNWQEASTATLSVSKSYQDTGLIGVGEQGLKDLLTFLGFSVVSGPMFALLVVLGRELTSLTNTPIGGPGVLPGVVVAAGIAWLAGPSYIIPAITAGAAVGAVTDALISFRRMNPDEMAFADRVFSGRVPYGLVWITNLANSGNRKFTWPSIDNSILLNLGDAFNDPQHYTDPGSDYQQPGQVFIHELAHAWQIAHSFFSIGLACDRIIDPSYDFGAPGPPYSSFTVEGQAQIVSYWFGGDRTAQDGHPAGTGIGMDPNDPYFGYIENNIRIGEA